MNKMKEVVKYMTRGRGKGQKYIITFIEIYPILLLTLKKKRGEERKKKVATGRIRRKRA